MENAEDALAQLQENPAADVSRQLSSYQLRPHLLDAVLPRCMHILSSAHEATGSVEPLQTIYVFSRVRGHKTVMQHFSTDAMLLEPLLRRLKELNGSADWQAEYVLLLWLASLVLTPFDLEILGDDLWAGLYETGLRYIKQSGIQRDAAALLVARLLTRERGSQSETVHRFVAHLAPVVELGELQVLAEVMDRVILVPSSISELVVRIMETSEDERSLNYYDSMLSARLWIKIMGRAALRDIPSFAEFVIAEGFTLLDNKSTRVRMTAAKYIARITAKLAEESAMEVWSGLLASLDEEVEYASPDYWNGALIALAELVRRKLLLSPIIYEQMVVSVLETRGLHFLQERLSTQVGTNVRDAACYVCWSLFRSVPSLASELRTRLFSSLIALATLDHEVNVRRAAAAALQEGLGRYGNQLDAKEAFFIMDSINFQSVSLISNCYLDIAPLVCDRDGYFDHFMSHGVYNANPDVRRLAAKAIPRLQARIPVDLMIDKLLDGGQNGSNKHGSMLALGALYTSANIEYRIQEAQNLIHTPGDSDIDAEAVLRLLPVAPERAARIIESLATEEKHVIEAARDLCAYLPDRVTREELLAVCTRRMSECLTHVACLVAIPAAPVTAILQASRLANPESRALAVSRLGLSSDETKDQLVAALNDYSVDDRGDVGGWVREAALAQVVSLRAIGVPEVLDAIWRMASGSSQKLREMAGRALVELELVPTLDFSSAEAYYYSVLLACPDPVKKTVARSLAASAGGLHANMTTFEGSFQALVRYLGENSSSNGWVLQNIMNIERTTLVSCTEVVRTLQRLVVGGIEVEPWTRVLAIAFNTTLAPRLPEWLVRAAVDILAVYAVRSPKACERLLRLVTTHRSGKVRQDAADSLFESGVEDEVLETTDWTRGDYLVHARRLKINK